MKKTLLFVFLGFPLIIISGQSSFNKPTISSAGEKSTFAAGSFTWTLGETAVGTVSGTDVVFLQGFAPTMLTLASPPTPPVVGTITQPTCDVATGSVELTGLPLTGIWTLTMSPGGSTVAGTGSIKTIPGLAAGTYTYTVTDENNLTSSPSADIVINTQPVTPTAPVIGTITQPTCAHATGSVILSGLPSTGIWTLTKSPGGTTLTGTGTTKTISELATGTYTYTVTNSSNCTSLPGENIVISTQPITPTAPVIGTITQPTCAEPEGSIVLSGLPSPGSWTITISPGGATIPGEGTTATIPGLSTGSYSFTVTNESGCTSESSSDAVLNTAEGAPSAPVIGTITQPTCDLSTGSVEITGLPSTGTWTLTKSPGGETYAGSGSSKIISGLDPGTYTVYVTNSEDCISAPSSRFVINARPPIPTAPVIGTITQPTCAEPGGSIALSGLPSSGSWIVTISQRGATIPGSGPTTDITDLSAGTYSFTVTNESGCTSISSSDAILNEVEGAPSAPVNGTITHPSCQVTTGSVELTGLPASGSWTVTDSYDNSTVTGTGINTTVTGLSPGSHTFSVTNDAGCTSVPSVTALVNDVPEPLAAPVPGTVTHPTCTVSTGSVLISGLPSTGNWTLTRSPGNVNTQGSGSSATVSSIHPGTYNFTVTGLSGCISVPSGNITINEQPVMPAAPVAGEIVQPTCTNSLGSVTISGLPGSGAWTLTRTPGGAITGSGGTYTVSDLNVGSYLFSVTGSSAVIIEEPDMGGIPRVLSKWDGEVLFCDNSGDSLRSYQWYKDDVLLPGEESQYIVVKDRPGSYTVQSTDLNGCKNFSSPVSYSESKSLVTYPNPAAKAFSLDFTGYPGTSTVMTIVNSSGIRLMEVRGESILDPVFRNIDISNLKEGTYIVRVVIDESELYFTKLVIIK